MFSIHLSKTLIIKTIITIIFLILALFQNNNFYNYVGLVSLILFLDFQYYLSLRNYFLTYTFLMFDFAGRGYFYPQSETLLYDMLIYIFAFVTGCFINKLINKQKKSFSDKVYTQKILKINIKKIEYILIGCCGVRFILFLSNIIRYGVSGFFSGQLLVNSIEKYGQEDFSSGLETIISGVENSLVLSCITLYIYVCYSNNIKINYIILTVLLVILPLVSLQRSTVIFGVLFLLLITYLKNRKTAFVAFLASILLITTVGISVGMIRQNALMGNSASSQQDSAIFIYGELSSVIAYTEIKELTEQQGYQYGNTIILPFFLKVIPRSWFPDKPLNSSAYYISQYYPNQGDSGFFLAPSIFGDIFLNFGYIGCVIVSFALGFIFTKLDNLFLENPSYLLPLYLIVYYHVYSFLRNNISDSLFIIFLSCVMFTVIKKVLNLQIKVKPIQSEIS